MSTRRERSPLPLARRRRTERGAVLVEAAFVVPVLLLLIIGVIEFGWVFFQYLSLRQGVREAAREAAISTVPQPSSGTWASQGCTLTGVSIPTSNPIYPDVYDMMCYAKSRIGLGMGSQVRVSLYWNSTEAFAPNTNTADPDSVVVCAQFQSSSLTGVYGPILNSYVINSTTEIRIEQTSTDIQANPTGISPPIAEAPFTSWPSACSTL